MERTQASSWGFPIAGRWEVGQAGRMATRVLIVDDDRSFRRAAAMLLCARGFEVVGEAADGREAIAAIEALQPDAVLLDVHLPDGDGPELARRLSPDGWGPRVLLTSSD